MSHQSVLANLLYIGGLGNVKKIWVQQTILMYNVASYLAVSFETVKGEYMIHLTT
jgi:hypothetical protein